MASRSRQGKGLPRASYTELKAKDFGKQIEKEFGDLIDSQLNGFVQSVVQDLTTDSRKGTGVSPVLTGFFASSWKADIRPIKKTDKRKDFAEWARIKTVTRGPKGNSRTVLAPGQRALIKQRYPVEYKFTRKKPVFIGNTVDYSSWALVSKKSKVPQYLQGGSPTKSMKAKIDRFFSDKRPDIRVGSDIRFRNLHDLRLGKKFPYRAEPGYSPQTNYKKS